MNKIIKREWTSVPLLNQSMIIHPGKSTTEYWWRLLYSLHQYSVPTPDKIRALHFPETLFVLLQSNTPLQACPLDSLLAGIITSPFSTKSSP